MENLLKQIEELREAVLRTWRLLEVDRKKARIEELEVEMSRPGFWDNRERAVAVGQEAEGLKEEVEEWENLRQEIRDLEELVAEAAREKDDSIVAEAQAQYKKLKKRFEKLEFLVLFSSPYDKHNAILSIHAGTGGVDAQDWAEMLLRMYLRFIERRGWRAEVLDRAVGNEAGIKSATIRVIGRWAYGYLKGESGVHRLVRISPFDAEAMRHTSFALVEVIPELPEAEEIEIKEEDLRVDTFRSSGAGGQHVNKTESAVRIVHKPTGLIATCQTERSQHQNRETALKILKAKLLQKQLVEKEAEERRLRGKTQTAEWGKQIRSYVLQPYKMVKDHRTSYETSAVDRVLDGELEKFMEAYLRWIKSSSGKKYKI
jgi:peptide chain release factor 2